MSEKLRCYGCGSILQVEDVTAPGYIQKDVLESDRESILCQRCFKMKNYGLLSEVTMKNEDFLELLDKISKENCLIVYVIDIFNFHASLIKN
ncbi:TPA: ribosome biogenesis GTPase YqeH, partial [bacterium]|nr:ribosome biogenesis GTPase YqeH [bacterium]